MSTTQMHGLDQELSRVLMLISQIREKLPARKRRTLDVFLDKWLELAKVDHQDEDQRETMEAVVEGIVEIVSGADVSTVPSLVDPNSEEVKKAKAWFAKLGTAIRKRRLEKKMTQKALAEKIGLSQGALSRIERGQLAPTHLTVQRIAQALGVKPNDIDPSLE